MTRLSWTVTTAFAAAALSALAFGPRALAANTDSQGGAKAPASTQVAKASHTAKPMRMTRPVGPVRNWAAIDTNHDNLIEPAEMEAYLNSGRSAKH